MYPLATDTPALAGQPVAFLDRELAVDVVHRAIERYVAARRAKIPVFVDRNFSLPGTLRLHRKAAGWDIVVAPVNVALAVPYIATRLTAATSRALGWTRTSAWLDRRRLFLTSAVARELEWRLFTELLELPYAQKERRFDRDALAEEILRDPRVEGAVKGAARAAGRRIDDREFRAWLMHTLGNYTSSRVAAGDLTTAILSVGAGAVAFNQVTPSMLTLGPALAYSVAQQAAIASFPLGAGLGGLWYGAFPAAASVGLVIGMTGGAMAVGAMLVAFSGCTAAVSSAWSIVSSGNSRAPATAASRSVTTMSRASSTSSTSCVPPIAWVPDHRRNARGGLKHKPTFRGACLSNVGQIPS
jgi:hypothetical protein